MRTATHETGSVGAPAEARLDARTWPIRLACMRGAHLVARAGFVAKAALYGVVGALALRAALGRGGATFDVKQALASLASPRGASTTLVLAAAGIAGLGLWFVLEGIVNPNGDRGAWAAISRVGQAVGGLGYVALAATGLRVALGHAPGPSGDQLARTGAAEALVLPGGPVVAVVIGLVAIGVGVRQAHLGISGGCLRVLDLSATSTTFRRWARWLAAFGFAAQGTLFGMVGAFLIRAVVRRAPAEARGTGGALDVIAARPYGTTLLAAAAVGLFAYALYAGIEGACRRFPGECPAPGRAAV
ncbi:DUF1206 domain-containing protein [Anaeromyxobacter oryzae]|uniref:DUF1206 domain-containing protein n=1 Tax=Anaeromyxobacter oryzae TaxID=2918170 RepID=A0ABM7X0Q8_9BACT|nr:DUF1206 domain-containing protein [Anaeromyxobacter oryzae]BDG05319.1 hypothetical protein AMOR_43150 [Anaeromyxobacter oryzae]